jgi:hypothetical protein
MMARNALPFLLLSACAPIVHPTYVQPTERVLAATPTGEKVAVYDVVTPRGTVATVKIWSNGVDIGELNGQERTLVHVGLEIVNTGDAAVRLRTPELRIDGDGVPALATRAGEIEVPGGSVGRGDDYFAAAQGVAPQDVARLTLRWSVDASGSSYRQVTEFVVDPSLTATPFTMKPRPLTQVHRHPKVVIRDGVVAR